MLIDGPSIVYRAYFAMMQTPLTTSDGMLVTGIFGFFNIVLRGMQDLKPDYAIVSFDLGKPAFRFAAYPDYKAGRPSMPDDLRAQFPIVRELVTMMGMPIRELEGYEADDVIGTLALQASADGIDTYIVSGDLDGLQLVDDHIRLFTTRMGVANTVIYDRARVAERYGLSPEQMLDYKALKGDTSDNLPGVPGVGEKTAVSLLQEFGSLDAVYERLDEVKGKLRERLATHREDAMTSREVGRIVTDLPIGLELETARTGHYDRRAMAQRLRELEFRSLIDRLPPTVGGSGPDEPEVDDGRGLQLSLDLLGGAGGGTVPTGPAPIPLPTAASDVRGTPDPKSDPKGAIENVDPRLVADDADRLELEAWLAAHGDEVGRVGGRWAADASWTGRCWASRWRGRTGPAGTCGPAATIRCRAGSSATTARSSVTTSSHSTPSSSSGATWSPAKTATRSSRRTWSTPRSGPSRSTTWPPSASRLTSRHAP